ncbi:MAG: TetR/AcrR family transcriptional regulator [Chloroflexi bacterium]|nr:TetR/AcrR family transcriptional regulator [Chloroflexota bacterium]
MAKSGAGTGRREATTSAILRATGELIAEKGIDGFTLSEVSRRAGINRALIYHYFQNRDNLIHCTIDDIVERNKEAPGVPNADAVESSLRLHIAHPEVSRVFFQLLLAKSPSLPLGNRLTDAIESIERYHREANIDIPYDFTFLLILLVLAQFSWPLSREAISKTLNISVEEADERFIAAARWATDLAMPTVTPETD